LLPLLFITTTTPLLRTKKSYYNDDALSPCYRSVGCLLYISETSAYSRWSRT
jgi:hypothetical protein